MIPTVIDAVILLVLAFFTWRGARKGLILTLFSFLAIFVAWFGAKAAAQNFAAPVAGILRPSIELSINEMLEDEVPSASPAPSPSPGIPAVTLPGGPVGMPSSEPGDAFSLDEVLALMDENGLYAGLRGFVDDAASTDALEGGTAVDAVAGYLANLIASALLFGLSFLLILLVWFLASRALDLAFDLPILSAVNAVGGAVLGLAKSVLLMVVVVWLARLFGLLTDEMAGPVAQLMTVEGLGRLLASLAAA